MSVGRSNVLTKEQLLQFETQEKELEIGAQKLKECQTKIQSYERDWQYIGEHLTVELQKRLSSDKSKKVLKELNTATQNCTKGEALELIITTTFEVIQQQEIASEQALEESQQKNKALINKIASLEEQLKGAEETAAELEQELRVGSLSQEWVHSQGTNKRWTPKKLVFWDKQREVKGNPTQQPKVGINIKESSANNSTAKEQVESALLPVSVKLYGLTNNSMAEAHGKIMDMVSKYVPLFSGERSPKLGKEVYRFLNCSKELYDQLTTEEKAIFIKCVKFRLTDDAYYLVCSQEPKDFETLQQVITTAYMPRKSFSELRTEMLECRQRPGEDIREFADRMKELLDKIKAAVTAKYPNKEGGLIAELETDAVATFKAGVGSKATQVYLTGRKFQSLDEVQEEASYFEKDATRLQTREPGMWGSGRRVNATARESWGADHFNNDTRRPPREPFQTGLSAAPPGVYRGPQARITPPRPIQCFQCGQRGHLARECPSRRQPPYCVKCQNYGHDTTSCRKQTVRFADASTSRPGELSTGTEILYCQFCRTCDHYTANCLKKYLAEQGAQKEGNGERQLGEFSAAAFN